MAVLGVRLVVDDGGVLDDGAVGQPRLCLHLGDPAGIDTAPARVLSAPVDPCSTGRQRFTH